MALPKLPFALPALLGLTALMAGPAAAVGLDVADTLGLGIDAHLTVDTAVDGAVPRDPSADALTGPGLDVASDLGIAQLQGPLLALPARLDLHTFTGPSSQESSGSAGTADAAASSEGAGAYAQPLVHADQAQVAAVGALAALGTLALQFEPLRRGLFLLAVPLYSRLRRSDLLDNQVRERIYQAVTQHPGLRIIDVCRLSEVGWGTAVYHLQRLERDRMIASRRDGPYRRFFLNGQAPSPDTQTGSRTLRHALARDIAGFVASHPQAAQKDVCQALGISAPLASKWLTRMCQEGLLTSEREWKHMRYTATPQLGLALAEPARVASELTVPA